MTRPLSWVVGAGGLLGSHLLRSLARRGPVWSPPTPLRWTDPGATAQLAGAAAAFLHDCGGGPWQVAWCAGAGVTGADEVSLHSEQAALHRLLEALTPGAGSGGALFVASSAGGVYAGSAEAPFTEAHKSRPLSAYGRSKLVIEGAATDWGRRTGVPVLIGRLANLYGPGQNLTKQQGLVSQLCRAHLLNQPVSVFVPMDTTRDYLFAPDCGELVADALDRLRSAGGTWTKILASHQAVTVGAVVGELRRLVKAAPRITYGTSATSHLQARDLRLRSQVWTELDRRPLTTLAAGMHATTLDLARALATGDLAVRAAAPRR